MENIVLTVHLILALLLVGVVLLQRSEGGGLGMGGGNSGGGAMSGRAAATLLTKLTWIFAILFICTSIALTVVAARDAGSSSVIDRVGGGVSGSTDTGEAKPDGSDLLPPVSTNAPLTPPKAEN